MLSCAKDRATIEIYLPKKRIPANYGVNLFEIKSVDTNHIKTLSSSLRRNIKFLKYDTIKNDIIYSGEFDYNPSEWNNEPFIKSSEIISYDSTNCKMSISKSAENKLHKLRGFNQKGFGQQFLLCVNKKPILKGYFIGDFHKYPMDYNYAYARSSLEFLTKDHHCIKDSIKLEILKIMKRKKQ